MEGKGKGSSRGDDMEEPGRRSRPARRGKGSTARRGRGGGRVEGGRGKPCSGKRGETEARKGSETGERRAVKQSVEGVPEGRGGTEGASAGGVWPVQEGGQQQPMFIGTQIIYPHLLVSTGSCIRERLP